MNIYQGIYIYEIHKWVIELIIKSLRIGKMSGN